VSVAYDLSPGRWKARARPAGEGLHLLGKGAGGLAGVKGEAEAGRLASPVELSLEAASEAHRFCLSSQGAV
jgi:hypothetical protein